MPGGRSSFTSWQDKDSLFIFGGAVRRQNTSHNDLWKFDLQSKQWTWLDGLSTPNQNGFAQAACQESQNNVPSGRYENRTLNSLNRCSQKMVTFGGIHVSSPNPYNAEYLNDLWVYNNQTRSWKLIWGNTNNGLPIPYNHGTKGVSANSNAIPGRAGHCIWNDAEGNIWIFGGLANTGLNGPHNDLWKFTPDTSCLKINNVSAEIDFEIKDTSICKGDQMTVSFPGEANVQITPATNVIYDSINNSATFNPSSKQTYTVQLTNNVTTPCPFDTTVSFTIDIFTPAIKGLNDTSICQGDTYDLNFLLESDIQITPAGTFTYDQNNHSASFSPNSDQTYSINLKSNALAQCPFDTIISFTLNVLKEPISDFEANLNCDDVAQVLVKNNSSGADNYHWYIDGKQFSTKQQPAPKSIEEIENQEICVSLSAFNRCFSDSSIFCISAESQFIIPNAFSPNRDGKNDVFKIIKKGTSELDIEYLSIFNRWGQRIFHTTNWQDGWDGNYKGEYAELGTYFFIIKVNEGSCTKEVKGDVTLLR